MKTTLKRLITLSLMCCNALFFTPSLQGAGLMKPVNGNAADINLKSHQVNVTINNGFARTEVDQLFHNNSSRDLEAVYSFPIPEHASLSELSLWINGKEVIGEVLEKARARQIYTQETRKRVDPALAEKNGDKSFDISVFPVVANADTRLRLVYYQPVKIESNVGRYVYPLADAGSDTEENQAAFWSLDSQVKETFTFDLTLKSAFPVSDVRLPGYQNEAVIDQVQSMATLEGKEKPATVSGDVYRVNMASETGINLNKDIVFYYRLAEDVPARVELVPYRDGGKGAGTFMVVVTPGADLQPITDGIDWVFVLDNSGSMRGSNMTRLIEGVAQCLGELRSKDRFRIVLFNNKARDLTDGYLEATESSVQTTLERLNAVRPGGGTNLFNGVTAAYQKLDSDRTTRVVLVTDAIGEINQDQHSAFLQLLEKHDVRLFTFVIGNGGDRALMERLARDSGGFAMSISANDDNIGRILQAKSRILFQNMRDIELRFSNVKVDDLTPMEIGPLYQGQQLVMFGQYDKPGKVALALTAKIGAEKKTWTCQALLPEVDTDNPELERLWALSSIEDTMQEIRDEGEQANLRQRVTKLGMDFSLVTDYTSMLVLEEHRFKDFGIERKNLDRVQNERRAQDVRRQQPVKSYRVDQDKSNPSGNNGMFDGRRSPGTGSGSGSGPVGPLFVLLAGWLARRRKKQS
jgi:Ca-activated chloride channel family protein